MPTFFERGEKFFPSKKGKLQVERWRKKRRREEEQSLRPDGTVQNRQFFHFKKYLIQIFPTKHATFPWNKIYFLCRYSLSNCIPESCSSVFPAIDPQIFSPGIFSLAFGGNRSHEKKISNHFPIYDKYRGRRTRREGKNSSILFREYVADKSFCLQIDFERILAFCSIARWRPRL